MWEVNTVTLTQATAKLLLVLSCFYTVTVFDATTSSSRGADGVYKTYLQEAHDAKQTDARESGEHFFI